MLPKHRANLALAEIPAPFVKPATGRKSVVKLRLCYAAASRGSVVGDGRSSLSSDRGIRDMVTVGFGVVGVVVGFLALMAVDDIVGTESERVDFGVAVEVALFGVAGIFSLRKSVRQSVDAAGEEGNSSDRSCIMSFLSSSRNQFRKDSSMMASFCWFALESLTKIVRICSRSATSSW